MSILASLCLCLPDVAATERLGRALAVARPPFGVLYLEGDLGAGKSTLARALLRRLGVEGAIRSPTYALVEQYPLVGGGDALHLDLYRIGDVGELEFLGLEDVDAALWLVEWPRRGGGGLPSADLRVCLEIDGDGDRRRAWLEAGSDTGAAWLESIRPDFG